MLGLPWSVSNSHSFDPAKYVDYRRFTYIWITNRPHHKTIFMLSFTLLIHLHCIVLQYCKQLSSVENMSGVKSQLLSFNSSFIFECLSLISHFLLLFKPFDGVLFNEFARKDVFLHCFQDCVFYLNLFQRILLLIIRALTVLFRFSFLRIIILVHVVNFILFFQGTEEQMLYSLLIEVVVPVLY